MNSEQTPIEAFHEKIVIETFSSNMSDDEAFFVFALLHMYRIGFADTTKIAGLSAPDTEFVYPISQRGAAHALAVLWNQYDDERGDYMYWYRKWNTVWEGYSHFEHLTHEEQDKLAILKQQLEHHPLVKYIELENE